MSLSSSSEPLPPSPLRPWARLLPAVTWFPFPCWQLSHLDFEGCAWPHLNSPNPRLARSPAVVPSLSHVHTSPFQGSLFPSLLPGLQASSCLSSCQVGPCPVLGAEPPGSPPARGNPGATGSHKLTTPRAVQSEAFAASVTSTWVKTLQRDKTHIPQARRPLGAASMKRKVIPRMRQAHRTGTAGQ